MIVLFEDKLARGLAPVAITRHVSHLLIGAATLRTRVESAFAGRTITLHGRAEIRRYHEGKGDSVGAPSATALFINARLLVTAELASMLGRDGEWILRQGELVVAARLEPKNIARMDWSADALDFDVVADVASKATASATLYENLWEMIGDNGARISSDFAARGHAIEGNVFDGAVLLEQSEIYIAEEAVVRSGAVLDATQGPIIIERGAEIMSLAFVQGPCVVGAGSRIKVGAKIYGHTSIGPSCKVGGEVESSIILAYSNKQHDGFLGHSYLGAWVNLGADTNTSDLKNNYGTIRVTMDNVEIDTGRMFLGALIGDHSKTGINTMLNTGTVIGVAANVYGGGFPPKSIPSFAWGGAAGFERFRLDRALELARTVMDRRSVRFTQADEDLLTWISEYEQLPDGNDQ